METIHSQIDELLAADVHGQLSDTERQALHGHLVECAECRQLHKEQKIMNQLLDENFAPQKADGTFEQRMLAGFRSRVPQRNGGLARTLANLMRLRATQITAVAALLLALMQVGRMITHENPAPLLSLARTRGDTLYSAKGDRADGGHLDALAFAQSNAPTVEYNVGGILTPATPPTLQADVAKSEFRGEIAAKKSAGSFADAEAKNKAPMEMAAGAPASEVAPPATAANVLANRKLVRNAQVDLEVAKFDEALQKITVFAAEDRGYIATTNSEKQANGKLRGQVIVKVLPDNLDRFLGKLRALGELKNQSIATEDVTKAYFDTESHLKNARVMEQRLIEILKKKSEDVNDLLQVEKELGRVREQIEQMQGELKLMDSQVQFATVTISMAEKDMNVPAAFLLKERAQLALYAADVEKIYNDIKAIASPKVQVTSAQLDRDNAGRVSARISMLIAPEESDANIDRVKAMGRVANFQVQTERIAQGGEGMGENAKTERDKVQLNITISRDQQEQAFQQTTLRIRTGAVDERTKELRALAEKQGGRVRSSSFSRDPDGREHANVSLRVPMKNYQALMQSLDSLGKLENVAVQRQDQTGGQIDEANAPADISVQVYTQGNVVSQESRLFATLRRTVAQGTSALMWSVRMIGVALAFFAPWVLALAVVIWVIRRIRRARASK